MLNMMYIFRNTSLKDETSDIASRYAAVSKHFSTVSLSSPMTRIVLVTIFIIALTFICFLIFNVINETRERNKLKRKARQNSLIAKRRYR